MGLFRRRREAASPQRTAAIAEFWAWWAAEGAAAVAVALDRETARQDAAALLSPAVHRIDPNLGWLVGPGAADTAGPAHRLVVTAEGDAELRPVARRWLLAAPPPDESWSFLDVKPPMEDPEGIQIGAWDIDVQRAGVDARVAGAAVHVTVHHPDFHHLDEGTRDVAAMLLLDIVLGEADVETWVGAVRGTDVAPLDPVPLLGLRATVLDLKSSFTKPDGSPRWAVLHGTGPGGTPVLASTWVPLRPGLAPNLDTHLPVAVMYADRTPEGLPGPGALAELRGLEDAIDQALGANGAVVAHETNRGARILHVYVDSTTTAADVLAEVVRARDRGAELGRAQLGRAKPDPGWAEVAHLRG